MPLGARTNGGVPPMRAPNPETVMTRPLLVCLYLSAMALAACGGATSDVAKGLPAGNAERGQQAFVALQCNGCHEVAGASLPPPAVVPAVALGGRMLLPPSKEQIAEDILLPSSHFARGYPTTQIVEGDKSRMPDYSKALTKEQVADLVAFLDAHYRRALPSATR
jgi:mono/diheme cytochrome c family protein